jgi:hypothetical protein
MKLRSTGDCLEVYASMPTVELTRSRAFFSFYLFPFAFASVPTARVQRFVMRAYPFNLFPFSLNVIRLAGVRSRIATASSSLSGSSLTNAILLAEDCEAHVSTQSSGRTVELTAPRAFFFLLPFYFCLRFALPRLASNDECLRQRVAARRQSLAQGERAQRA